MKKFTLTVIFLTAALTLNAQEADAIVRSARDRIKADTVSTGQEW